MSREIGLAATALALMVTLPGAKVALEPAAPVEGLQLASQTSPLTGADVAASVTSPLTGSLPTTVPSYPPAVRAAAGGTGARVANNAGAVTAGNAPLDNVLLAAYQRAAAAVPESCNLETTLLAAIGQVESGNLANYELDAEHAVTPPVLGPVLDGTVWSKIRDTDFGVYDGDQTYDRAVGPMQFIPSTWLRFGVDLDQDGQRNPQDIDDAAGAAAAYLCHGGRDLGTPEGLRAGVFSYNHSESYVDLVLAWKAKYDEDGFGSLSAPDTVLTGGTPVGTREITTTDLTLPDRNVGPVRGPRSEDRGDRGPRGGGRDDENDGGGTNDGQGGKPGNTPPFDNNGSTDEDKGAGSGDNGKPDDAPITDPEPKPVPTDDPSPTEEPTEDPSPTDEPTEEPTQDPSPTDEPSEEPSPTDEPSDEPSEEPSEEPVVCDELTEADIETLVELAVAADPTFDSTAYTVEDLPVVLTELLPDDAALLAAECDPA